MLSHPTRSIAVVVLLSLLPATSWAADDSQADTRPNIIVVLVDDMGFSDIGCYGSEIETPNIDALAAGGLRFTQFYNSGRCCPTRASLMTGLQPHQVGIGHMTAPPNTPLGFEGPYQGYLNQNCVTIAEVLRDAGYHTMMTGKWHLGSNRRECFPLQRGFDRFYGGLSGAFNYFKPGGDRGMTSGNDDVSTDEGFYATDDFTDVACEYISDITATEKSDQKPFFLYLAYNAPHWPLNAKWSDYEKYRDRYAGGWEELMELRHARQLEMGLFDESVNFAPHVGPKWESLKPKQKTDLQARMAAYAGCVDSIDQNIGKLTGHLKKLGQLDNTLIVFLSDNGACQEGGDFGQGDEAMVKDPPLETVEGVRLGLCWANACNVPFRKYKHFNHEGGMCTPMIAHFPAKIADANQGKFVRSHAYLPDIMATAIDLAGAKYPADAPKCIGKSFAGTFDNAASKVHDEPLFWEHEGNAAVRDGDWKLVREYKKPWELYNIADDRTELNNLAESNQSKRDQMIAMWEAWATETQVAFPVRFNMYQFLNKKNKAQKN